MYFTFNDNKISAPSVPFYVCGTTKDYVLTLVTETGDGLTNAYLALIDPNMAGILQAKIGSGSFEEIGLPGVGICWIGSLADGESIAITFRIMLNIGFPDGLYLPTVAVLSGDALAASNAYWTGEISDYFTDQINDYFI